MTTKNKTSETIIESTDGTTAEVLIPTAGVNDTPQTKQEKSEAIKQQMLNKFSEDEKPLVEYLLRTFQISLWISTDKQDLTWLQQVGEKFVIIGKTKASSLANDVGYFYTSYEEMADGNLPLDRFAVEVKLMSGNTSVIRDCVLSQLRSELVESAKSWNSMGYGEPNTIVIDYVKIVDRIPF